MGEFWRRLLFRIRGERFDRDLAEEMQLHVELLAEEKREGGMAGARKRFGNATQLRETSRDAWGWTSLDTLKQDVRYGLRTLRANPGFAATAVLSLALGIGANTAIFGIVNALMLRSLPVEDPSKLVQITINGNRDGSLTNPMWEEVRDHQQGFSGTLAYSQDRFDLAEGGESHFAKGLWVSGGFFGVLGVPAVRGRVFTSEDDRHGGGAAGPVAVISYNFWERHFQKDPGVIGKTVRLNRHSFEIVGVTPPWFMGLDVDTHYEVAIPIGCEPLLHTDQSALNEKHWWWLQILGRVWPGESVRQAGDRMSTVGPDILKASYPEDSRSPGGKDAFVLLPAAKGFSETGDHYKKALFTLMAIVGLVLLIACANIANLMLARASARQREFSVRMAIGASRWRVVRQLMTESLIVSLLGAGAGLLLALWGGKLLVRAISTSAHGLDIDLSPDLPLLGFTMGVAVLTALLFGLAPAFRATRIGLSQALKENARSAIAGSTRFNLGKMLVAVQVALALVLLVGAGLFVGTLRNLLTLDVGFSRQNVLLVNADVQQASVPQPRRVRTYAEILDRLRAIPGVTSASSSVLTPISGRGWNTVVEPEGYTKTSFQDSLVYMNRVSPGFFETMGTPLLMGRGFDEHDGLKTQKVMILSESAARHYFTATNPVGKTIRIDLANGPQAPMEPYVIIGVAKDSKYRKIDEGTERIAYVASGQDPEPWPSISYELRSGGPVEALIPAIRSAIGGLNHDISLEFRSLQTQVNESLVQPRIVALLAASFGALALLLAMVGLYGVTSYAVARRKGEIGIRMALGAQRGSVVWLMLRDVLVLLGIGVIVGLAGSLAAGRLVASLLFGIRPNDPAHLAVASLVLLAAAGVAAYVPSRRASRLDPMKALREE